MFSLRAPDYDEPPLAYEPDDDDEGEAPVVVVVPPSPVVAAAAPNEPEGPVVPREVVYESENYYDLVCRFANSNNFLFSLARRNRNKDFNVLGKDGRLRALYNLMFSGESSAGDEIACDDILAAWAPETGIVTPPAPPPLDFGPEAPKQRTIESALINEIYYHLGFDRAAPPEMPPSFFVAYGEEFLYRKIHSPEGSRTVLLTGVVYLESSARDPVGEAGRYIAGLQDQMTEALGPFIHKLRLAPLKQDVVRYRSNGVRPVVYVVALVQWNGGLERAKVKPAFDRVRNLMASDLYRMRAFPGWMVKGNSAVPGQKFAELMLQEIRDYFVDLLDRCRRRLPRAKVVELAQQGEALEPGSFERLDPARIPADKEEIDCYVSTWIWTTWNYALYSRTQRDFEWFLRLDEKTTALNNKSAMFVRVFSLLQRFYNDDGDAREFAYAWGELHRNLRKIGVDRFQGPLREILLDYIVNDAYRTHYYAHPGSLTKEDVAAWSVEAGGATYVEYREAAIPAFVIDPPRMRMIADLLLKAV